MTRVGIRRFRAELRRWLDRAAKGEEILVTDRGKAVAKVSAGGGQSRLDQLIAAGIVIPPRKPKIPSSKIRRVRAKGSVADIVIADRR